jgi:hypothetical protein
MFQLLSEEYYRCLIFASSDHENPDLHPKLEVTYAEPFEFDGFLTIRPDSATGKDAFLQSRLLYDNFGAHPDFSSMSGTNEGIPFEVRNLITFNLNELPPQAIVKYSGLSLYSYNSPTNGPHRTLGGSNESLLVGVIAGWDEQTVTWDTQPETTEDLQAYLPESQSTFENYLNIDVTPIIRVMADHENYAVYGMLLKLVDEEIRYRNMIFASSDHPDPTLHPKLVVCYAIETSFYPDDDQAGNLVYPNPAEDQLNIMNSNSIPLNIDLYNTYGQFILAFGGAAPQLNIDVSFLPKGLYYLRLTDNSGHVAVSRFVKR